MGLESIDLVPGFEFWRDGCHTFAKNVLTVLPVTKNDVTPEDVLRFVRTLPRVPSDLTSPQWKEGYCCQCLEKAFASSQEAVDYFVMYFVHRGYTAQAMLIDAFVGIVCGVEEAINESEKGGKRVTATDP